MAVAEFEAWLRCRLEALTLDEPTVQYVRDLVCLDADETEDEKLESVRDFLGEAMAGDANEVASEIITKWGTLSDKKEEPTAPAIRLEDIAKEILERPLQEAEPAPSQAPSAQGTIDARLKAALLSQYDQPSGDEDDDSDEDDDEEEDGQRKSTRTPSERKIRLQRKHASAADIAATFENTNAKRVLDGQKAQRESSRADNAARVSRDKAALLADRESKAKKKEERRKQTQKQERRS